LRRRGVCADVAGRFAIQAMIRSVVAEVPKRGEHGSLAAWQVAFPRGELVSGNDAGNLQAAVGAVEVERSEAALDCLNLQAEQVDLMMRIGKVRKPQVDAAQLLVELRPRRTVPGSMRQVFLIDTIMVPQC